MIKTEALQWDIEALLSGDVGDRVRAKVKALIAAARAEGAEQMSNQIRLHGGNYTQKGDLVMSEYISPGLAGRAVVDLFIFPASVLAPKEKL